MRAWVMMYKSVVQIVLLFESESWVVADAMLKALQGLHHKAAWRVSGCQLGKLGMGDGSVHR